MAAKVTNQGNQKYWLNGNPSTVISSKTGISTGKQKYWINGRPIMQVDSLAPKGKNFGFIIYAV